MAGDNLINIFTEEVYCTYKEELYSVRNNGAVLRHPQTHKRPRPADNQWTFGKLNNKTGYMEIASIRVHRIIATAFLGEPPNKEYVVDHIDTNKCNNRRENLRWVTRLENVLLNPITIKRIETACGCSVEEFLSEPSKFRDKFQEPNYKWMCAVSKEEAQYSLNRLLAWAKSDKLPSGGSLDAWIFSRAALQNQQNESAAHTPEITISKTPGAVQQNWDIPSEFPCCPPDNAGTIDNYAEKLIQGAVFCKNNVYSSLVLKSTISEDRQTIFVITESSKGKDAIKPWALAKIIYENGLFLHISLGSFFTQDGVEKQYNLAQGLEWLGGESIDDYC